MAFEFKVPGTGGGGAGGGGAAGANADKDMKESTTAIKNLTKSVALGNSISRVLSTATDALSKLIDPLLRVLGALFVVIFLPLLPLITKLIDGISDFTFDVAEAGGGLKGVMAALEENFDATEIAGLGAIIAAMIIASFAGGLGAVGWTVLIAGIVLTAGDAIAEGLIDAVGEFWTGVFASILVAVGAVILFALGGWIAALVGLLIAALVVWGEDIKNFGKWYADTFLKAWSVVFSLPGMLYDLFVEKWFPAWWEAIKGIPKLLWSAIKDAIKGIGGFFGGGRAEGGPVSAGASYLVGENGPEIFTPGSTGNITPNGSMGGSITININNPVVSKESDIRKLTDAVGKRLQAVGNQRFS